MKLKISVNKNCKNKGNPQNVASGWLNISETEDWLEGWVKAGFGWCATHFADRRRNSDNSRGSNLVVVDIDGDTTLEKFWETVTAKYWCIATYTSASHTDTEHRFRALFPLEMELSSTNQHRGAYWLVVNRLVAELGIEELKDNCGQKPERLWYGNTNAVFQHNPNGIIPKFLLNDIDYEEAEVFTNSDVTPLDIKRCQWLLRSFLRPSSDGEYESYYVPLMAACAGVGSELFDDWVDWVLRGHHGEKPENIKPHKWKGLGSYAGHTSIYALAKKQDPNWTRSLPNDLKFSYFGSAAGYDQIEPEPSYKSISENATEMNPEDIPDPIPDTQLSNKRGRAKKSADTAAREREDDVNKVKAILTDLRRNTLTYVIEYTNNAGKTVELQGSDLDLMTTKLSVEYGVFIPEQRCKAAIQYAAGRNTYCPIKTYLDKCAQDAKPHADWDHIGEVFLGNSNKLATLAMQRMMIGAVARAYNPGCSMSWLPILVGAQGVGKSMFSRSLVPEKLFSEVTVKLEKLMDEQYRLHVGWLLELPEIDHFFNTRNIENFKNLITTRCDEIRRPYASLPERLPRRFVMIGTTNRNQFLVDSTGNRRFVPLEIGSAGFLIPWKKIAAERDMLWAAAINAYKQNIPYEFNSGEIAEIADYIQEFGDPDPWSEKITAYVSIKSEVTASQVLTEALDLDPRQQGRRESRRVADVLQTLGWRRNVAKKKDTTGKWKSIRVWQRPKDDPLTEDHIINAF